MNAPGWSAEATTAPIRLPVILFNSACRGFRIFYQSRNNPFKNGFGKIGDGSIRIPFRQASVTGLRIGINYPILFHVTHVIAISLIDISLLPPGNLNATTRVTVADSPCSSVSRAPAESQSVTGLTSGSPSPTLV